MTLVIAGVVLLPLGLLGFVLVMAILEDGLMDAAAESGDSLPEARPQSAAAHEPPAVAARPSPRPSP
ncbi:MAG: hypothetical protein H0V32_00125 [Nocardioidaceae bacterium]|nr:hypothetical protein [Nocardioidaceae bacterium]MDQ3325012.1 hypothetical protein [Actinomycetota bacterium]